MSTARWVAIVGSIVFGAGVSTMLVIAALSHLDGRGRHRQTKGD